MMNFLIKYIAQFVSALNNNLNFEKIAYNRKYKIKN